MSGMVDDVPNGTFCEIWLMRNEAELVYRRFSAYRYGSYDEGTIPTYKIEMNDFFMHLDTPTQTNTASYWVKMRTYTNSEYQHNRIQQAMRCSWMLLEAKR